MMNLAPMFMVLALLLCGGLCAQSDQGGPAVILDQAHAGIFPGSWLAPRIAARAELLEKKQQERCRRLWHVAQAKYPATVVQNNLRKVYFIGHLEYSGVPTGGTNSRSAIYIVNKSSYSDRAIEGIIHAEFSSILLRNHGQHLDKEQWQQLNPPGFQYLGTGGVNAIRQKKASLRFDSLLHAEGFVNEYGKSNFEDDFNGLASHLFVGGSTFWAALEQHPRLMAKADLVIQFYHALDPRFTKEWFRAFRQSD